MTTVLLLLGALVPYVLVGQAMAYLCFPDPGDDFPEFDTLITLTWPVFGMIWVIGAVTSLGLLTLSGMLFPLRWARERRSRCRGRR